LLNKFSSLVSLLSPFSSLVMQTPIFLTKLSFIIDVGKIQFYNERILNRSCLFSAFFLNIEYYQVWNLRNCKVQLSASQVRVYTSFKSIQGSVR
jgi:hypothetical protein